MKNHYRYFQRAEKSPWIPIEAQDAERSALNEGAVRLTVLSTNIVLGGIDEVTAPKETKFHGPLYFDIDHSHDIPLAIASANRLVERLVNEFGMDERDIEVYLSGSKGLHIFIQPECFNFTRSIMRLPKVYLEMAKHLYVSGVDMQVYSVRNAFRLVNVQRDDGKYRVRVTCKELKTLTLEKYQELTAEPRHTFRPPQRTGQVNSQLAILFEQCQEIVRRNEREPAADSSMVFAPQLRQEFSKEYPPCIMHLADGKRAETKSFNEVAMQVAIFAARLSPDGLGTFEPTFARIADNQTSSNYSTARERQEHMEGLYQYVRHTDKYNFSCNAMRGVLKSRVCRDCILEASKVVETPEDAAREVAIESRPDGYFDMSGKTPRRVSTFRIVPDYVFNERLDDGQIRRIGTVATVESNGASLGTVMLDESAWTNRAAFLRALGGVSNVSFFGSETDIQKVKYVTMSDPDLPERSIAREMGLHITRHEGKEVRTYVEKTTSINNLHIPSTMVFEGPDDYEPYLIREKLGMVDSSDAEALAAIKLLLTLNEMEVMGPLVGWQVACHLKPHMMHLYRQFPPVNLWGNAGNGKTTIARYTCVLGGVDFVSEFEEMNIPISTPFAWLASLSNSTSNPVLWDEVNKSGNRMPEKKYAQVVELLKGCWNGQVAKKGALNGTGKSPVLHNYRLIRPVIYCSEQQPELPALVDRSLSLLTREQALKQFDGRDRELRAKLDGLKRVAYTLMLTALSTPTQEVARIFNECMDAIPSDLRNRPRYTHAISLLGLRWLRTVMDSRGLLDDELAQLLVDGEEAVQVRVRYLASEQANKQMSTEVDRVFAELMEIIDQSQLVGELGGGTALLRMGVHFELKSIAGQYILHLDVRSAHSAYLQWARRKGITVILDNLRTFLTLATQESYVLGVDKQESILGGRHVLRVDLVEAERRGLPVELLGNPDDF